MQVAQRTKELKRSQCFHRQIRFYYCSRFKKSVQYSFGVIGYDARKLASITQRVGTSNKSGTGLDLLLCKKFVEKNGGKI